VKRTKIILLAMVSILLLSFGMMGTAAQDEALISVVGSYQMGTRGLQLVDESRDDRALHGYVWYPALVADGAERPYPPDDSGAPYPLIIYSHGYGNSPTESLGLIERLVSHGFVVAAVDHLDRNAGVTFTVQRPLDVLFLLNQMAELDEENPLAGLIDTDHVGVVGFSMGGYTTIVAGGGRVDPTHFSEFCADNPDVQPSFYCDTVKNWEEISAFHDQVVEPTDDGLWAALTDERIKAILPIAPCNAQAFGETGLATISIPTFIVGGTIDESCPYELDAAYYYEHIGSAERSLVTLDKRNHGAVIREIPLLQTYATAFFGLYLQDKTDYAQYLTPETASAFRNVTLDVTTEES
jgi:predicted dienelactone hydrolase